MSNGEELSQDESEGQDTTEEPKHPLSRLRTLKQMAKDLNDDNVRLREENTELRAKLAARGEAEERQPELERFFHNLFVRVHPASKPLLEQEGSELRERFLKLFKNGHLEESVVVLSIDIRRSTELMLLAKDDLKFSNFMTGLVSRMQDVITHNFGIYDKFTGDGLLSFFPTFFSGDHALRFALNASIHCRTVFKECYEENMEIFHSAISDIGIGIGIDSGNATIIKIAEGITVVGKPVVYACRLSDSTEIEINGPTGKSIVNKNRPIRVLVTGSKQPEIGEWDGVSLTRIATRQIKGSSIVAYKVDGLSPLSKEQYESIIPKWVPKDASSKYFNAASNLRGFIVNLSDGTYILSNMTFVDDETYPPHWVLPPG